MDFCIFHFFFKYFLNYGEMMVLVLLYTEKREREIIDCIEWKAVERNGKWSYIY